MKNPEHDAIPDAFMQSFDAWLAHRAYEAGFPIELLTDPATTFDLNDVRAAYLALTRDPDFVVKLNNANDDAGPALNHLRQVIASGRLMGDELRALREHAPRFVAMLCEGLNVGPDELTGMAAYGSLNLSVIERGMR